MNIFDVKRNGKSSVMRYTRRSEFYSGTPPRMSTFALFASYFIIFTSVFDRLGLGSFRYLAILVIAVYLLMNLRTLLSVIARGPCIFFIAFIGWVVLAAYVNSFRVPGIDIVRSAIIDLFPILEVGLLISVYAARGYFRRVVHLFFWWQFLLVAINDMLLLVSPGLFGMESSVLPQYLMGNKFGVVYGHFLLFVLLLMKYNGWRHDFESSRLPSILLVVLTMIISVLVDCMTGVIGIIVLYSFIYLNFRFSDFFTRPIVLIAFLLLSCSFMFVYNDVLNNGVVKFILENVLGTTPDITGRGPIYEQLPSILSNHLIYGYGYGTCHILGPLLGNFVDTQNGLAEWIWRAGVPSVVLLCLFLWSCVSNGRRFVLSNGMYAISMVVPLISFLFTMSLLASVEITLSSTFFVSSFLLSTSIYCSDDQ